MSNIILDNYNCIELIGKGINSKIYWGKRKDEDKLVIIKLFKNYKFNENILNEIEILSNIKHKNFISILFFKKDGEFISNDKSINVPYVIFEYCKNGELFDYLSITGKFSEKLSRKYFLDLIISVSYFHNNGYCHRNLKPENLLLDENFELKIINFKFSILMSKINNSYNFKNKIGTLNYLAPELINNLKYNGDQIDIFSLGIVLFNLVIGKPPFIQASNKCKYFNLIINNNYKKFWSIHQKIIKNEFIISEDFKNLINLMINPDPNNRISIEEILDHPWTKGDVIDEETLKQEMSRRKKLIDSNNNLVLETHNSNLIKPNFRNSEILKEFKFNKCDAKSHNNLKYYKRKDLNPLDLINSNRLLKININHKDSYWILIHLIEQLQGKIVLQKANKITSIFKPSKEHECPSTIEFSIYSNSQCNESYIKILRIEGTYNEEWKWISEIRSNLKLINLDIFNNN